MGKQVLLFSLLLYWHSVSAQTTISSKKITTALIPQTVTFMGKLVEGWKWKDKSGENFLLLTKTTEYPVKSKEFNEDARSSDIYAYQFVKSDTGYTIVWKLTDYVKECPFDITLDFFRGSVFITDLDADSIAEATIIYKLSCRSDVSPDYMKLIMREGVSKYALRGFMCDPGNGEQKQACVSLDSLNLEKLLKPADEWEQMLLSFGRYESEKEFFNAPTSFLAFARKKWLQHITKF